MIIKTLNQYKEVCAEALSSNANLNKSFKSFFSELMILLMIIPQKMNFLQFARYGNSCESRFRMNFCKSFNWIEYNAYFTKGREDHLTAIAIDPSYIPKSGKMTPGISYFWSGCASSMKRGLEILGIALVDATTNEAIHLRSVQTFVDKVRGRKPKCVVHMEDKNSLIAKYLLALNKYRNQLLSISQRIVADAYFSKESFVTGAICLGFNVISRFRDDVRLLYLFNGPKTGKRGRPKMYAGKVNLKELDLQIFIQEETTVDSNKTVTLFSAVVHAVALKRNIKVVIVDCEDENKKTQVRKVFFSTDTSMTASEIFFTYKSRFQIEFLYRDAKNYTGLTHCQAREKKKLDFHFNASLTAVNVAHTFCKNYAKENGIEISVSSAKVLLHNATLIKRIISMSGKSPNMKLNNTIFKELVMYGVKDAA